MNPLSPLAGIVTGKKNKPPRLLIYGTEGIGKSTLASQAPSPIFIPTEEGLDEIDCASFPLCENYASVTSAVESLIMEEHSYGTVVIDSADWLERLIHDRTCTDSGVKSIELAAGGYGKGYTAALNYWRELLAMLDACRNQRGMVVILIAHAQIEKFEDPESAAYDRYSPRLHKKTSSPLIVEWADAALCAMRKVRVSAENEKSKRMVAAPIGRSGGDRILRCVGGPTCVAKNRYDLPDELPLSWEALASAMANEK